MSLFFTFFIIIFIAGLLITLLLMPNSAGKKAAPTKKALPAAKTGKKPQTLPAKKPPAGKPVAQTPPPENKVPTKQEIQIRVTAFASHCSKETALILGKWIRGEKKKRFR